MGHSPRVGGVGAEGAVVGRVADGEGEAPVDDALLGQVQGLGLDKVEEEVAQWVPRLGAGGGSARVAICPVQCTRCSSGEPDA